MASPHIKKLALPFLVLTIGFAVAGSTMSEARTPRATVTPGPTAENASVYSEISFRGVNRSKAGKIKVRGSRSGPTRSRDGATAMEPVSAS